MTGRAHSPCICFLTRLELNMQPRRPLPQQPEPGRPNGKHRLPVTETIVNAGSAATTNAARRSRTGQALIERRGEGVPKIIKASESNLGRQAAQSMRLIDRPMSYC